MEDILCNKVSVLRFRNKPVPSNTYLLIESERKHCLVIDPGSKDETVLCNYIRTNGLTLDYVILTHEHFDHCWGVNDLRDMFHCKVIATRLCAEWVKTPRNYFNQLYFNSNVMYQIEHVDIIVEDIGEKMLWYNSPINFVKTPGHTNKSMCIEVGGVLFTGDTILYRTKPFLKAKYGASKEDLKKSIERIYKNYPANTMLYPGHGEPFLLGDTEEYYINYFYGKL